LLDAAESVVSVGVRELCCRLGVAGGSFERAAGNLDQAARVKLSEETFRRVVEREGKAVLAAGEGEQLELDFAASDCKLTTAQGKEASRIYATCDGVLVPVTTQAEKDKRRASTLRKRRAKRSAGAGPRRPGRPGRLPAVKAGADQRYKQVYVTAFYDQEQTRRLVGVTRRDHKGLGKLLGREAARIRLRGADERVGLIDGAPCLRTRMERLPLTALGLDFYHLATHVHQGRLATFGEDDARGKQWADDLLHTARHDGYELFWEKLADWRGEQRRGGGKRQAADGLLNYVAQRQGMIAYDRFERRGWHIGSGPIEAMCKATTRRIKGPGMRWDSDNAEALMALEALHQSNLWEKYWTRALTHSN